jgi:predicted transcriptional regulator
MQDEEESSVRVRVPTQLLKDVHRLSNKRDETLSQVVRRALRQYVAAEPRQTDLEDAIRAAGRPAPNRKGGK